MGAGVYSVMVIVACRNGSLMYGYSSMQKWLLIYICSIACRNGTLCMAIVACKNGSCVWL